MVGCLSFSAKNKHQWLEWLILWCIINNVYKWYKMIQTLNKLVLILIVTFIVYRYSWYVFNLSLLLCVSHACRIFIWIGSKRWNELLRYLLHYVKQDLRYHTAPEIVSAVLCCCWYSERKKNEPDDWFSEAYLWY